jgi:hypothetical protein
VLFHPLSGTSVNEQNIETLKTRWLDQGRPRKPDWNKLLEGLVD